MYKKQKKAGKQTERPQTESEFGITSEERAERRWAGEQRGKAASRVTEGWEAVYCRIRWVDQVMQQVGKQGRLEWEVLRDMRMEKKNRWNEQQFTTV